MKTTTPQVSIKLDAQKIKKNGEAPIYVHVNWKGRAKRATGIYCKPSEFSSKTLVKGNPEKNKALRQIIQDIEENIAELGLDSTAKDFLQPKTKKGLSYVSLLSEMAKKRGLEENTVKSYLTAYKIFQNNSTKPFYELDVNEWQGYAKAMKNNGYNLSTIWINLTSFKAILNYALETGRIKENPLKIWKFKKDGYKSTPKPRALTRKEVKSLWEWYEQTNNKAGLLWFTSYFFNGLALCDIINMNWEKLEVKELDNITIIKGETYRKKTNEPVPIICPLINDVDILLDLMEIIDELKRMNLKEKPIKYWASFVNKQLKKSPIDGLTFYSARHTYCTNLVNSNTPLSDIATLLGRRIEGLSVYIKQLQTEEHLAEVLRKAMTK